jgi:hypothetical protein
MLSETYMEIQILKTCFEAQITFINSLGCYELIIEKGEKNE